ncbi:MAG: bifunctional DNA-formamidopyrimidine glycosylase/DNA-(apurinic or apyrimidinic site) lyase [Chloroflexaceae bacterium]|nr:bifunctional DNA-formamidopyrimidine glycosylase/DNA-(apurinic or apyrimidinic site) lyase [Chloroflexaceae bacterium]NJL34189.1 bifunctional DNA-formamidopyrimidine glycosylase/DNA-(apurinic or apyrimidinic site) lyase [Chloroflexaceae bacterium]NJO05732.1 bifunctional DNA-formamidopyrimidine glycosylase/DNA-(apurinic or apyrimidinic site) lyase [Chloroflexaceae bacterium]
MPELPEVETAARDLAAQVIGRQIVAIEKLDWERMIETPTPAEFHALLPGRQIVAVGRRAKWLLLTLDAGWTLAIHLRMSGSVSVHPPDMPADVYTHLVLRLDDERRIFFHDTRKFGRVRLLDAAGLVLLDQRHGPEPLSETFTEEVLAALLRGRRAQLKPLLLNQAVLAGLGNIYVDESLWRARLHPLRLAASLTQREIAALYEAIRTVLTQAVQNKGSTLRDYRTGYGQSGENQHYFMVYGKTNVGQPCSRCGTAIVRLVVGQRGTHICPQCQQIYAGSTEPSGLDSPA